MNPPIFLFTDFGWSGPYVGQLITSILGVNPASRIVSLMHDAPAMRPDLAAYLLAACCPFLPRGACVLAVVDPGVGGDRFGLMVETADLRLVGPDNGLLSRIPGIERVERIDWRPSVMSSSFHGRDLFAPVVARLAAGDPVARSELDPQTIVGADWPRNLPSIIFIDAFGNLMTGINAAGISRNTQLRARGRRIGHADTFCSVSPGELFWYPNSQNLVEIAANGASAAQILSLAPGDGILLD